MDTPLKILTVDNEPSITLSLSYVFSGDRYEVTGVENGEKALAVLRSHPDHYDVIIVDQKMPNLTGVELVREIRQRGITAKIIIISAHLSSELRETFHRMDVRVLFPKPFDIEMLRLAVERMAA